MKLISKEFNELTSIELYEILKARAEIFIMEQKIHYQNMDNIDYNSMHCFIMEEDNRVIAYLRAFYQDDNKRIVRIGRVLTLKHGNGVGRYLMEQSLKTIKEKMNCRKICMNAQKQAIGFYEKFDFKVTSDEFLEEGVVHVVMELDL